MPIVSTDAHRASVGPSCGLSGARAQGSSTHAARGAGEAPEGALGNNAKLSGRGQIEAIDQETGEVLQLERKHNGTMVLAKPSRLEQLALAYRRKAALDKLLLVLPKEKNGQPHRCYKCHRYALPGGRVAAMYSEQYQKAFIAGTQVCANQWLCPICSRKLSKRKAEEVEEGARRAKDQFDLRPLLITLDFRHTLDDKLAALLKSLTGKGGAYDLMNRDDRDFKALKAQLGWFGDINALEITRGEMHGWHPHRHGLTFIENKEITLQEVQERISAAWARACAKLGRYAHIEHGCNVQEGDDAANYISKMAAEIAAGSTKNGRQKGRSYPQLLDGAATGDKQDIALWKEWALATKGRHALRWSNGLRKKLGMGEAMTDQQIAEETEDASARVFSLISHEGWNLIYDRQLVSFLCFLIETDAGRAHEFINSIEEEAKK